MGPTVCLYAALAGFFACASIYHLILWWSFRRETLLIVFSANCVLLAIVSMILVAILTAETKAAIDSALRARMGFGILMMISWLWCLTLIARIRSRWFVFSYTGLLLLVLSVHTFVVQLNPMVASVTPYPMPWGEVVPLIQLGRPGWWYPPLFFVVLANYIFCLICGFRVWKQDWVAGSLIVLVDLGMIANFTLEILRAIGSLSTQVYGGVIAHVPWVCVIALLIAREHRKTRDQLAASEQRFRGIFDQTFQFIGLIGTDGTLIEANRTALEFAQVRSDEVIGKPFWQAPWWSHSSELQARLRDAIRNASAGSTVRFEVTHPRPDGDLIHVDFSLKPIRNEQGQVTLLIPEGRDITERRIAEDERRVLEGKLTQARKLEAIGQLAGGVAHDFNNLLTVINGNTELVLMTIPADDPRYSMMDGIRNAGARATALTQQLLTFSHRQVVAPRILDLNGVVSESENLLRCLIGEQIFLVTILDSIPALIRADADQIDQVILNLAVNARDSMTAAGTLTIQTAHVCIDAAEAQRHPDVGPGRYVVLSVSDTGCGMTAEVQSRIFDPFFTTKSPDKGTGLGLSLVRTIAEQNEAQIRVESQPGRGSSFKLYFPALTDSAISNPPEPEVTTPSSGNETIMLVEDQDDVRSLTRQFLTRFGYTVIEATGGPQAISIIEQRSGPIDLLITDVVMPEMGGRQLVERMKLKRPDLKILYVSGYADDVIVRHGVLRANVAFLQKPFTMESLARKVRQTLDTGVVDQSASS